MSVSRHTTLGEISTVLLSKMTSSHVVFDGYSYEPPSYEEAQARGPLNQSVYKPTVSQNPNVVIGGLRPLYTTNGYTGFSDYNTAKRKRKVRIACASLVVALGFMMFILFIWKNSFRHAFRSYDTSYYDNNLKSGAYPPYKDSSVSNDADYDRNPVNDDYKPEQLPNESVFDRTELGEHNDHLANNGNQYGSVFDEVQALGDKYNLIPKPIASSSENPVASTDKVTDKAPLLSRFNVENFIKEGIVNPKTGEIDEDKARQLIYG